MEKKSLFFWVFVFCSSIRGSLAACSRALGMEKGLINDSQITASSEESPEHSSPSFARLHQRNGLGGWCPDRNDKNPFLQIDLLTPHTITKIATQGADSNFIERYRLSFSYDNTIWYNYTVKGEIVIFTGNIRRNVRRVKNNNLTQPLTTRVLRIHPMNSNIYVPCARVELYGCTPSEDCKTPVGVEDGRITDQQMTASSQRDGHNASNARLNNELLRRSSSGKYIFGGWCSDKMDIHQYLQIDLGRVRSVSGVATQGYTMQNFVKAYKLNYSTDGTTWQSYREKPNSGIKIFQGNWDNDTVIKKMFPRRIFARYIRLNPISWNPAGDICMRVEIYECLPTQGSIPLVSPPSETVKLNRTSSVNLTCIVSGQPGFRMNWYKNRNVIPPLPLSQIHRTPYVNGSRKSVLTLNRVKYKDRRSIISCSAWYPTLSINSTRNIHLLVHAPRPVMVISEVQARQITLHITDPTPADTLKYLVRYKKDTGHAQWVTKEKSKVGQSSDVYVTLNGVHPFTAYVVEVASYYKDQDEGPYSIPKRFTTKQAAPSGPPRDVLVIPRAKDTIRVSWSIPSAQDCNGIITKYEIILYKQNGLTQTYPRKGKTLYQDISGLELNQRYIIGVRACTKVGPGPYSRNHSYSTEISQGSQITQALEKLNKVPVTNTNALKVMKEIRNITSKPSELVRSDLSYTANILAKVVKTNVTSADVGDHVLDTISHVMDAKPEVLQDIQQKNNKSAQ